MSQCCGESFTTVDKPPTRANRSRFFETPELCFLRVALPGGDSKRYVPRTSPKERLPSSSGGGYRFRRGLIRGCDTSSSIVSSALGFPVFLQNQPSKNLSRFRRAWPPRPGWFGDDPHDIRSPKARTHQVAEPKLSELSPRRGTPASVSKSMV